MEYRIRHDTVFAYEKPVSVCHNSICLTPQTGPRQRVQSPELVIDPRPEILEQRHDAFGNVVHAFSIETAHERLSIRATSLVTVLSPPNLPADGGPAWESVVAGVRDQEDPGWLEAAPFLHDSPLVTRSAGSRAYAAAVFTPGRPVVEAAIELTNTINRDFAYDPGATHVGTSSEQALELRRGVCQDFAHVQLASLRAIGLPARYVSGYLRTVPPPGRPRLVGADESHAWVAVYAGPDIGWVDLDPTNAVVCGTDHVTIATGRDYTDVAPIRGVFLGGGRSTLTVEVDVMPVNPAATTGGPVTPAPTQAVSAPAFPAVPAASPPPGTSRAV
jgi:transglutaminase-like putative cysteine protease